MACFVIPNKAKPITAAIRKVAESIEIPNNKTVKYLASKIFVRFIGLMRSNFTVPHENSFETIPAAIMIVNTPMKPIAPMASPINDQTF